MIDKVREILRGHWVWINVWDRANESRVDERYLVLADYLLEQHPEIAEEARRIENLGKRMGHAAVQELRNLRGASNVSSSD